MESTQIECEENGSSTPVYAQFGNETLPALEWEGCVIRRSNPIFRTTSCRVDESLHRLAIRNEVCHVVSDILEMVDLPCGIDDVVHPLVAHDILSIGAEFCDDLIIG